ncbi:MAG TPA: hydantoinase/oxoprolinase family protein [Solirubrobacteraceae bacterium]|jgi:N-methylhydantoinase A
MLLGVDVGGTFTDAVLLTEDGGLYSAKVPSTPAEEARGVMAAIRELLDQTSRPAGEVSRFAHGMTVATNALLEGRGARTALLATAGFTDVIALGRQNRPHLYRLAEAPAAPLVDASMRFAVDERLGPAGTLKALDAGMARALVERVARAEPEAVAVALLHSYRDPGHEQLLGELARELLPDASLSLSSELVGTFREYERTATTVLDASLSPLLSSYLARLSQECSEEGLPEPLIMQSSGGLTESARAGEHAALTVLSGPAGGAAGALLVCASAEERDVACFDMGGTSCDVCLIEGGRLPETAERTIAGRPVVLPALDIHTVGAGGGSIAWRDEGGALRVGPRSAGAEPGPACYGRGGGEPTVTDANLLLGRLLTDAPLAGGLVLDVDAARAAIERLAETLGLGTVACAEGILRVAEAEMLGALRLVTVERGLDPRGFALMAFGGAGGLHAAALADALGIDRLLCPRDSGVLSALGLAAAAPRRDVARTVMLDAGGEASDEALHTVERELIAQALERLGTDPSRLRLRHDLRYRGQSFELGVEQELREPGQAVRGFAELREDFARTHAERYGYRDERATIELVTVRVSVWGPTPALSPRACPGVDNPPARQTRELTYEGRVLTVEVLRGEPLPGTDIEGPVLCAMAQSTLLVPPGWRGGVDEHGTIVLRRRSDA